MSGYSWSYQCPEPLCTSKALPRSSWSQGPRQQELPCLLRSYGLMRQSSTLLAASVIPSDSGSMQVAVSPCWEEDLPDVVSAHPSLRAWTPTPAALEVRMPVSSPKTAAFPPFGPGRRSTMPVQRLQHGALFEAAVVHSCRPAGVLTTQVAPTATASAVGQPWFLRPSLSRFVTSPCPGYACRPNRAIDGRGLRLVRCAALSAAGGCSARVD